MSSHSTSASVIYKNERRRKTWHHSTYKTNLLNLVENKLDYKKNCLWKEKALRDTQIRSKHELGKMKRAQIQQVDEFSMQKWIKKNETIQQLTSQLQQMQEQMNILSMIPENFKMWNRIFVEGCLTFPVILWWFLRLIHPEIIHKEFNLTTCKETEKQSRKQEGRTLFTQVKTDKINSQFQCRHLQQDRSLRVLQCPWKYHRTTWSDSRESRYRTCNSTNSLIHNRFLVWKIRFKTQVTTWPGRWGPQGMPSTGTFSLFHILHILHIFAFSHFHIFTFSHLHIFAFLHFLHFVKIL